MEGSQAPCRTSKTHVQHRQPCTQDLVYWSGGYACEASMTRGTKTRAFDFPKQRNDITAWRTWLMPWKTPVTGRV